MPNTPDLPPELAKLADLMDRREAGRHPPRPEVPSDDELLAELANGSDELEELRRQYENHPTKGTKR